VVTYHSLRNAGTAAGYRQPGEPELQSRRLREFWEYLLQQRGDSISAADLLFLQNVAGQLDVLERWLATLRE
jgi:hypothetical protein